VFVADNTLTKDNAALETNIDTPAYTNNSKIARTAARGCDFMKKLKSKDSTINITTIANAIVGNVSEN
jgi:hypothetical protein